MIWLGGYVIALGAALSGYAIFNDVRRHGRRAWQVLKGEFL